MRTKSLDIETLAAELGLSPEKFARHIEEAIEAGLLRISEDCDQLVIEAVLPDD